jgi:hypothetical protein
MKPVDPELSAVLEKATIGGIYVTRELLADEKAFAAWINW